MKQFITKTFLFVLPVIALSFEAFFPLSFFTYRPWEALMYHHRDVTMPFYPNQILQMISEGDLCHNTNYAIKKNELWITDKLGYRNNQFIKDPDVLIIGDSFMTGTSLTQDSIFTNVLASKFNNNLSIYCMAPANFSTFIALYESKIIEKPKVIIFSIVERNPPRPLLPNKKDIVYKNSTFLQWRNRALRLYSLEYINARLASSGGDGKQAINNENLFFLNGVNQSYNMDNVIPSATVIESYKNYCDSLGVRFLFLPLPNKETVYYKDVPFKKQPNYLLELDKELRYRNISCINSLEVLNNYTKKNSRLVYNLDDTHWNANGVEVLANEIVREMSYHEFIK